MNTIIINVTLIKLPMIIFTPLAYRKFGMLEAATRITTSIGPPTMKELIDVARSISCTFVECFVEKIVSYPKEDFGHLSEYQSTVSTY